MPHQRSFRLGWQSENLARFILYKFCFLAQPAQIVDDIGIDFFCTLFESKSIENRTDLLPRSSFAIQIKSYDTSNNVDLTKYLPYLEQLELPFFIGIINRNNLTMTIFSGEFLIPFFVYKGIPVRLKAELCDEVDLSHSFGWMTETSQQEYTLQFPKIAQLTAQMDDEDQLRQEVEKIQNICLMSLENIASKINKRFILKTSTPYNPLIFAGPDSIRYFQVNLVSSLTEVFFNLNRIYSNIDQEIEPIIENLFQLYENIFHQLTSIYQEAAIPELQLLKQVYEDTKAQIDRS